MTMFWPTGLELPIRQFYENLILRKFEALQYIEAAPIPYVQDTILNLLNPYLRSTTILLDMIPSVLGSSSWQDRRRRGRGPLGR